MNEGFGPYDDQELAAALAACKSKSEEEHPLFRDIVDRYRDFIYYVNEESEYADAQLEQLDRDRRRLHQQTVEIARALGRTAEEVFTELLHLDETLESRGLPEFAVMHRDGLLEERQMDQYHDEDDEAERRRDVTIDGIGPVLAVRDLRKDQIGVVFLRKVEMRIPSVADLESERTGYIRYSGPKLPLERNGDPERVRRAVRLADRLGVPLLYSSEFTHNVSITVIGIPADEETLNRAASEIRNDRERFGIRDVDLDPGVVEGDRVRHSELLGKLPTERRAVYEHEFRGHFDPKYTMSDSQFVHEYKLALRTEERAEREAVRKAGKKRRR